MPATLAQTRRRRRRHPSRMVNKRAGRLGGGRPALASPLCGRSRPLPSADSRLGARALWGAVRKFGFVGKPGLMKTGINCVRPGSGAFDDDAEDLKARAGVDDALGADRLAEAIISS
jgi:hypothetical protein